MATYRQDVTQNVDPAMANPSTLARASEAQAQAARSSAEATSTLIKGLGTAALAGAEAYGKYQDKKTVEQLKTDIGAERTMFEGGVEQLMKDDLLNKSMLEQGVASARQAADEFKAASILAGADPDEVRAQATIFGQKQENSIVAQFRSEQQRIIEARDALPQRQHEFMTRSEKLLKTAIAAHPELANNFRRVATEVTGKENLDLYSIRRLYEDVSYVEKQKEAAAKQQAEVQKVIRDAYIDDRVKGGISKTQALAEFDSFSPTERMQFANVAVGVATARETSKAALEKGGNDVLLVANSTIAGYQNMTLGANAKVYAKLKGMGVTQAMVATGNIPTAVKESGEYKTLLQEAADARYSLLDAQYREALTSLENYVKTRPADATQVNQSRSILQEWYKNEKTAIEKDPTSFLVAMSTEGEMTQQMSQRLQLVSSLATSLQLPADVVANIGMGGDSRSFNEALARYPKAANSIQHINKLRQAALMGVSSDEWTKLLRSKELYDSGSTTIPTTANDKGAALTSVAGMADKVSKAAINGVTPDSSEDLSKLVAASFINPENNEHYVAKGEYAAMQVLQKLPKVEADVVKQRVTADATSAIYRLQGHGDRAKGLYNEFVSQDVPPEASARVVQFDDLNGLRPLKVTSNLTPKDGVSQGRFADRARADIKPNRINAALKHVDAVLLTQSRVTGTPIDKLRIEFMQRFNQTGTLSDAFNKEVGGMLTKNQPTTQATTAKTVTMAEIDAIVERNNVSREDAIASAIQRGYTIGE